MGLHDLFVWMEGTEWSIALHESRYAYSLIESVHVWTLCVFVGLAAMMDLRLIGATLRDVPMSVVVKRLMPWMFAGFVIMIITGALLFYAIPVRSYHSVFFRLKLVLLVLAGLNAWVFHSGVWRRVQEWDLEPTPPRKARLAGVASLALWALIIVAGRMIAYNWFDCDRPQPSIIATIAGCVEEPVDEEPAAEGSADDLND